jgi:hypothetical protein
MNITEHRSKKDTTQRGTEGQRDMATRTAGWLAGWLLAGWLAVWSGRVCSATNVGLRWPESVATARPSPCSQHCSEASTLIARLPGQQSFQLVDQVLRTERQRASWIALLKANDREQAR